MSELIRTEPVRGIDNTHPLLGKVVRVFTIDETRMEYFEEGDATLIYVCDSHIVVRVDCGSENMDELKSTDDAGSGYGTGYGSGSGDGDGSGSGTGTGYGSGSGTGTGYGSGSGTGYGSGSGTGTGDGTGYGSGDGSG
jgi:hypothetical protein